MVDQYVELRTGESKNTAAEVMDPDGKRLLSAQEATTAKTYPLAREGFYEVTTATGKRSLVAAHADRRESDLAVIPKETLDLWTGTGSGGASGERHNGGRRAGTARLRGVYRPFFCCYCWE